MDISIISQLMVTPQPLELTAVNENILMDNLDVFLKNGFKFQIDKVGRIYYNVCCRGEYYIDESQFANFCATLLFYPVSLQEEEAGRKY